MFYPNQHTLSDSRRLGQVGHHRSIVEDDCLLLALDTHAKSILASVDSLAWTARGVHEIRRAAAAWGLG